MLGRGDRPGAVLGSGLDTVVLVVSPVALAVATAVYQNLVDKTGEFTANWVIKAARRRFGHRPPVPEITDEARESAMAGTRKLIDELTTDPELAVRCAAVVGILLAEKR